MRKVKFIAIFVALIMACAVWSPMAQASYNYASKQTAMEVKGRCHGRHHHKCHGKRHKHHKLGMKHKHHKHKHHKHHKHHRDE